MANCDWRPRNPCQQHNPNSWTPVAAAVRRRDGDFSISSLFVLGDFKPFVCTVHSCCFVCVYVVVTAFFLLDLTTSCDEPGFGMSADRCQRRRQGKGLMLLEKVGAPDLKKKRGRKGRKELQIRRGSVDGSTTPSSQDDELCSLRSAQQTMQSNPRALHLRISKIEGGDSSTKWVRDRSSCHALPMAV